MKKVLLVLGVMGLLSQSAQVSAQEITCYDPAEASAVGFWFEHPYFGKCTDYEGAGSKSFEGSSYIDFNGGSSVIFDNIYVEEDGTYYMTLNYGTGWAHDTDGCSMTLWINDEWKERITVMKVDAPPAQLTLEVELWGDGFENIIRLTQDEHWPIVLGIELSMTDPASSVKLEKATYTIDTVDGEIVINNLEGKSDIRVYGIDGKLVDSAVTSNASYHKTVAKGVYVVKVNERAHKVSVQ